MFAGFFAYGEYMFADLYQALDRAPLSFVAACLVILLLIPPVVLYEHLRGYRGGPTPHPAAVLFWAICSIASIIVLSDAVTHWLGFVT